MFGWARFSAVTPFGYNMGHTNSFRQDGVFLSVWRLRQIVVAGDRYRFADLELLDVIIKERSCFAVQLSGVDRSRGACTVKFMHGAAVGVLGRRAAALPHHTKMNVVLDGDLPVLPLRCSGIRVGIDFIVNEFHADIAFWRHKLDDAVHLRDEAGERPSFIGDFRERLRENRDCPLRHAGIPCAGNAVSFSICLWVVLIIHAAAPRASAAFSAAFPSGSPSAIRASARGACAQ
ncbi:hypothetical protein [Mesorhizobium escarrei]|nr:hypothetical protein [Mesorhizobium escarrei]